MTIRVASIDSLSLVSAGCHMREPEPSSSNRPGRAIGGGGGKQSS